MSAEKALPRYCKVNGHQFYGEGWCHGFMPGYGTDGPSAVIEWTGGGVSVLPAYQVTFIEQPKDSTTTTGD